MGIFTKTDETMQEARALSARLAGTYQTALTAYGAADQHVRELQARQAAAQSIVDTANAGGPDMPSQDEFMAAGYEVVRLAGEIATARRAREDAARDRNAAEARKIDKSRHYFEEVAQRLDRERDQYLAELRQVLGM